MFDKYFCVFDGAQDDGVMLGWRKFMKSLDLEISKRKFLIIPGLSQRKLFKPHSRSLEYSASTNHHRVDCESHSEAKKVAKIWKSPCQMLDVLETSTRLKLSVAMNTKAFASFRHFVTREQIEMLGISVG